MGDIQVAYYDLNQETFEFDLDLNQDRDFAETLIEYPTEIILKKCFFSTKMPLRNIQVFFISKY